MIRTSPKHLLQNLQTNNIIINNKNPQPSWKLIRYTRFLFTPQRPGPETTPSRHTQTDQETPNSAKPTRGITSNSNWSKTHEAWSRSWDKVR
ncbi:hypothetical protein Hanom_Chr12g01095231 [Helianthus anomalus]